MAEREAGVSAEGEIAEAIRDGARWICRAIRARGAERPARERAEEIAHPRAVVFGGPVAPETRPLAPEAPESSTPRAMPPTALVRRWVDLFHELDAEEAQHILDIARELMLARPRFRTGQPAPAFVVVCDECGERATKSGGLGTYCNRCAPVDAAEYPDPNEGHRVSPSARASLHAEQPPATTREGTAGLPPDLATLVKTLLREIAQSKMPLPLDVYAAVSDLAHAVNWQDAPATREGALQLGDTPEEEREADEWALRGYESQQDRARSLAGLAHGDCRKGRALIRSLRATASELAALLSDPTLFPPGPSSPPISSAVPANCPAHGPDLEPDGFTSHCSRLSTCPRSAP